MQATENNGKTASRQARRAIDGALSKDRGRLLALWSKWNAKPDDPALREGFAAKLQASVAERARRAAALPAASVVGIFSFLWTWKAFVWPLVIIQTPTRYTIPVGLAMLQSELGTNWPLLMAATTLATLPMLLLYALVQRRAYVLDFGS